MIFKTLSNKKVSNLCLGTWSLGRNNKRFQSYGILKQKPEDILRSAYQKNINFFDTANVYGNSEEIIGKVFEKIRRNIFIATKVGCISFDKKLNFSRKIVKKQIQVTKKNLRTDYIDLVQLYGPPKNINYLNDCLLLLKSLKKKKIIRYIGVSLKNPSDYLYFRKFFKFDAVQFNFNILDHRILQNKIMKFIIKDKILFLPRTILNFGIFTEDFINGKQKLHKYDHRKNWSKDQTDKWIYYAKKIRNKLKIRIEEVCYRFIRNFNFNYVIFGATNKKHINQAIKYFFKNKLKKKEIRIIDKIYNEFSKKEIIKPYYKMKF
jgi:aryl-alcohol dehydrogenase-like predicted oxidoreductase